MKTYEPTSEDIQKIDDIFTYHQPQDGQSEKYIEIRDKANQLAKLLQILCPPSRELSLAITNLQQTVMFANAAIAINE